jgi:CheY-like chemotaxis protein
LARTVLLADDSVTAQNMGRRILMDAGYEVITVNNGSAALKKIHESPPDLIVLDVYMPGYGGLEVCQRLKESGETMRIPVLLTVGKMEPFKSDEAKRVRADGHIIKPFDASELLAALTKLEDRIVPQNESQRGRKGKGEKKPRSWPSRDSQGEWSEGVAYLAEVKEREAHSELVEDPEAEKAQQTIADAELPARNGKSKPPAAAPSLAPPPEFEVQETVALGNVAEQQSSPASQETPVPDPAPVEAADLSETAHPNLAPVQAPEDTSLRSAREETPAEAEPGRVRPSRWIAENVALTAEEASLALEEEMLKAQAASSEPGTVASQASELVSETRDEAPAIAPASLPSSAPPVREQPNQVPENFDSGATFAAAAGASADATPVVEAQPSSDPPREAGLTSEARAAWDNWQRIRDSVISAQNQGAVAGSVVEALQSRAPEAAREEEKNESGPVLENAAVASIVETLLAELKPKLMEEIAKKLKK